MICFRCGSDVPEGAPQCPNCGQRFAGARRTFTTTTTSFRALEKRRLRAAKAAEKLPYGIGDVIRSRYEVRDLVGKGPLGVVYRVHDQEIEVDVALKVFHPSLLESDEAREALRRTIRKVRKLSQQNIVRLYEQDEDGEHLFVTMQMLEGLTLRKVIGLRQEKESRFSAREVEPILTQVCMALGHAHRHTVHGDLKPENVIILPDVLKLTDFGAHEAVPIDRFIEAQTEADAARYLAPELRDGRIVDARADIYSLGAILYELLTGRPFADDAPPPSAVLEAPEEAEPGGVDAIVARATAPDPADRYETAEAFSEALSTYVDARELASVDVRAAGTLLPEDVTRKVRIPAGLRDDDPEAAEAPASDEGGADADVVPAEVSAEGSYVEELSGEELDALIEASESVDVPGGDPALAGATAPSLGPPPLDVGRSNATPTEAAARPPPGASRSEPWFLRSTTGFVAAVVLLVGGVLAGTLWLIDRLRDDAPSTRVVRVVGDGGEAAAGPEVVTVVAEPLPATPDAASARAAADATARADAARAVAEETPPSPPSAVPESPDRAPAVTARAADPKPPAPEERPEPDRPKPSPRARPSEPAAAGSPEKPDEAPRPAAPKPPEAEKPAAKLAVAEKPTPKPAAPKPPEVEKPAPKPAEAEKPAPRPAEAEKPAPRVAVAAAVPSATRDRPRTAAPAAGGDDRLSCPPGMLLIRKVRFPRGSYRGNSVIGAEGVKLAREGKAYCIDAHEYPGRGRKPRTNVTLVAAEGLCKAAGKRLCSDDEWRRACRGRRGADYPYGKNFDPNACNTEDANGDERVVAASGSFRRCRSAVGAYDMSGNVAEWTRDQTVRGGDVASADEDAACSAGGRRAPSSARPTIGFRCCADLH